MIKHSDIREFTSEVPLEALEDPKTHPVDRARAEWQYERQVLGHLRSMEERNAERGWKPRGKKTQAEPLFYQFEDYNAMAQLEVDDHSHGRFTEGW